MDLIDYIKQLDNAYLPGKHLVAVSLLTGVLSVLTLMPDSLEDSRPRPESTPEAAAAAAAVPQALLPASPLHPQSNAASVIASSDKPAAAATPAPQLPPSLKAVVPPAPEPKKPSYSTQVKSGDNLSLIFARAGLSAQEVYRIANSGEQAAILSRLYPGYTILFDITPEKKLRELEVVTSPLESYRFTRKGEGYDIQHLRREPETRPTYKSAVIADSLFLSATRGGISASMTMELAGMFGGVIDFLMDIRQGDSFNVLYEEQYLDGERIGTGAVLAARFINQGEVFTALRYENARGEVDYYTPEGESMRKAFLLNPVDFTRISSSFNLSRRHPIHNTIRAHKGTDYAAPTGTPVVATADGVVSWAARNGSFGKLVVLQHGGRFETKYAHLNDYARGIKKGTRVKQGQVVGYVGATGGATGPHLHYEFLMDGVHRNSRTIHDQLPKAEAIPKAEMAAFRAQTQPLLALLDRHNQNSTLAHNPQRQ